MKKPNIKITTASNVLFPKPQKKCEFNRIKVRRTSSVRKCLENALKNILVIRKEFSSNEFHTHVPQSTKAKNNQFHFICSKKQKSQSNAKGHSKSPPENGHARMTIDQRTEITKMSHMASRTGVKMKKKCIQSGKSQDLATQTLQERYFWNHTHPCSLFCAWKNFIAWLGDLPRYWIQNHVAIFECDVTVNASVNSVKLPTWPSLAISTHLVHFVTSVKSNGEFLSGG